MKTGLPLIAACGISSCLLMCLAGTAQSPVLLHGRITRANGSPLAGAQVKAFPLSAFSGPLPFTLSNEDGSYKLLCPFRGRVRIIVIDEREGFPDTSGALFAPEPDSTPEVNLSEETSKEIDVQLAQPDGSITLNVVNSVTGKPISLARVLLRVARNPQIVYSTSINQGEFTFDLPLKEITITVGSAGFRPLNVINPKTGKTGFILASSDRLNITASLDPLP